MSVRLDAERLLRVLREVCDARQAPAAILELKLLLEGYLRDQDRPSGLFCYCGRPLQLVNGLRETQCGACSSLSQEVVDVGRMGR